MKELESLQGVFKDRIFKIPDYQRGFAWTTRQLKDFWEDVINLPIDRYHYTGVLSLKKLRRNDILSWNDEQWLIEERDYRPFHVVDGQQRLTTFIIFIQAVIEILKELPENIDKEEDEIFLGSYSLKEIKEAYLVIEKPPQSIIRTYKFGYEVDNPSFKFLRHNIFQEPDSGTVQETFYTLNLQNAKSFFKVNLASVLQEDSGIENIKTIFKKITQNLKFNVYEISDDFDVFVAFETMNNRGKNLSNLELLKNRLIYLTTLYEEYELKHDEQISLREKINDAWKEVYYQLGRNKKHPLNDDSFLIAHWIMYFQYTREKGDDYIKFLLDKQFTSQNIFQKTIIRVNGINEPGELIDNADINQEDVEDDDVNETESTEQEPAISKAKLSPKEIENYVNNLKAAALHWYNTFHPAGNPDLTKKESLWLDRLNRIGIVYFRPLITASFLSSSISVEERVKLFKAIERYIFITFRLSRAFSNYGNSEFYRAARQLRNNELTVNDIINMLNTRMGFCFKLSNESNDVYFDHTYFQKYMERKFKNEGGFYNWNGLRYFLYEYEMQKVREWGNQKIDWKLFVKSEKDKVTIEHIYPQSPNKECWLETFDEYDKEQRHYFKGTLGNLLPLSKSINSSLQNDCFKEKKQPKFNDKGEKIRQGYSDGSHSEIEVSTYNNWHPKDIFERGIKLLKFMEKRWDIRFENEKSMKDLLFLGFVDNKKQL